MMFAVRKFKKISGCL